MADTTEVEKKQDGAGKSRDIKGRFPPGISGNPEGRKPDLPEQKVIKKAIKEIIREYKEKLAEALPGISPVLTKKAIKGDIQAIKEIHDRVMGKPPQDLNIGGGEGLPFIIKIVKDAGNTTTTEGTDS